MLTTFAAVLVHIGGHWHPETPNAKVALQQAKQEAHHATKANEVSESTDHQTPGKGHSDENQSLVELNQHLENSSQDHDDSIVGALWQFAGVIFFLWGITRYHAFQKSLNERRRYDLRALSEGLRVQIYWVLAGLSDSVAAS